MNGVSATRASLIEEQARMLVDAKSAVLNSGDFVPTARLLQVAGCSRPQLDNWQRDGEIFAIEDGGEIYWPVYAFAHGQTHPSSAMAMVLKVFGNKKSGWSLALWFVGLNSFLNDKRPQDVLATNPRRVIDAAKDHIDGLNHG